MIKCIYWYNCVVQTHRGDEYIINVCIHKFIINHNFVFCFTADDKNTQKPADQLWPNWASIQWSRPVFASGDRFLLTAPHRTNKRSPPPHTHTHSPSLPWTFYIIHAVCCSAPLPWPLAAWTICFYVPEHFSVSSLRCVWDGPTATFSRWKSRSSEKCSDEPGSEVGRRGDAAADHRSRASGWGGGFSPTGEDQLVSHWLKNPRSVLNKLFKSHSTSVLLSTNLRGLTKVNWSC